MKSILNLLAAILAAASPTGNQPHALPPLIQPSPTYPETVAPLLVTAPAISCKPSFQPQPPSIPGCKARRATTS